MYRSVLHRLPDAYQNTALEPDTAFVEVRTIDAIMGTMLGGIGTVIGPVVGMGLLFWLREVVWANFMDCHLLKPTSVTTGATEHDPIVMDAHRVKGPKCRVRTVGDVALERAVGDVVDPALVGVLDEPVFGDERRHPIAVCCLASGDVVPDDLDHPVLPCGQVVASSSQDGGIIAKWAM